MMINLNPLPQNFDFNTKEILLKTIEANKALAELKGYASAISNKNILLNALTINEAKDSSEIEHIMTTHDGLYKALSTNKSTKEANKVVNYKTALLRGYELSEKNNFISTNMIIEVQKIL